MIRLFVLLLTLTSHCMAFAIEYHVSPQGHDSNKGSFLAPFKTISKAASIAVAGDTITVHQGVYREMVVPPRGGNSDVKRITYRAAPGEKVEIKGSEIIKGWQEIKPGLWMVSIPYHFFGRYNPYTDKVYGDWYNGWVHTGEVYLEGRPLSELDSLYKIKDNHGAAKKRIGDTTHALDIYHTWYTRSDSGYTNIYARFGNVDPNKAMVEINVRPACFYPDRNFINYITIQGFEMSQAATQWAAPTAEQPGLIGTNWSKGWIIENNIIHDSKCSGITLGKDRYTGDNTWSKDKSIDGSLHYNEMVHRVIAYGWNKDSIGSHIVRNNTIYNCGEAGICGSFGGAYSHITGNHIYNIYTYRVYGGAEMGAIKLHAAVDAQINDNYVHHANIGLWLDWMTQGTRVSGNLFHDNNEMDFFIEVSHGPYLVDNNFFLSTASIRDMSQGGAFVHNVIGGAVSFSPQKRKTPFFSPHTTHWLGIQHITGGDNRYYNNVFTGSPETAKMSDTAHWPRWVKWRYGLAVYDSSLFEMTADGNLYTNGKFAVPGVFETQVAKTVGAPPVFNADKRGVVTLQWNVPASKRQEITTAILGKAIVPAQYFENPDGRPLKIDRDYFGRQRNTVTPNVGPLEPVSAKNIILWPKK